MDVGNIVSSFAHKAHAKSSVLTPLLWLCGISLPTCFIAAVYIPSFATLLIFTPISLIGITVVAYIAWAFVNPDRLQSEEFLNRRTELQLMQNMEAPLTIEGAVLTVNPNALPADSDEVAP